MNLHKVEEWLESEGKYKYHCFISWPHTADPNITKCARTLQRSIYESLAGIFHKPRVFLDEDELKGGDKWKQRIKDDLCHSVTMVAVCAPIYYHPAHEWCGFEWAAMQSLSNCRAAKKSYKLIIPVMVRMGDSLPLTVSEIQYIDVSRSMISGPRYYKTTEFREKIEEIVKRIKDIAIDLSENEIKANCDQFHFPERSAFWDHQASNQEFPFV